jgi:hypothetical protein
MNDKLVLLTTSISILFALVKPAEAQTAKLPASSGASYQSTVSAVKAEITQKGYSVDSDFVRILAKSPLPAKKIAEGIYAPGGTDLSLEVKGRKFRVSDSDGTGKWRPISELTYIRKGVLRVDAAYWCLFTMSRNHGNCTASGWSS